MKTDKDQLIEYLHKVDISSPGLYMMKLKEPVPTLELKRMVKELNNAMKKWAPNSHILILPHVFEPVFIPDDKTMERLGWVRKKDIDEDEILDEIMEKAYSIDSKKINSLNGVNK